MVLPILLIGGLTIVLYRVLGGEKAWKAEHPAGPRQRALPPVAPTTAIKGYGHFGADVDVGSFVGSFEPSARAPSIMGSVTTMAPAAVDEPPLSPAIERLLALLVLFQKDKPYAAGQKKYLTPNLALEASRLAGNLGLPKTSMAVRKDAQLPGSEYLPGRTVSVRASVQKYAKTGSA